MNKEERLKEWNLEGLFPAPGESEERFERRVSFCLSLREWWGTSEEGRLLGTDWRYSAQFLDLFAPTTEKLYGIRPSWVPVLFTHRHLLPWHPASTWIFSLERRPSSGMGACIVIRSRFLRSNFLRELLAHEMAHVARMGYEEPQFEEM